jgi:hypothetical protein
MHDEQKAKDMVIKITQLLESENVTVREAKHILFRAGLAIEFASTVSVPETVPDFEHRY